MKCNIIKYIVGQKVFIQDLRHPQMKSSKSSLFHIHEGISLGIVDLQGQFILQFTKICGLLKYNASSKHFLLFSVRMESNETVIP